MIGPRLFFFKIAWVHLFYYEVLFFKMLDLHINLRSTINKIQKKYIYKCLHFTIHHVDITLLV